MSNEKTNNVYQLRPDQADQSRPPQRLLGPGQKAMIGLGLREPEDYGTTFKALHDAKRPLSRRAKAGIAVGVVAGLAAGGALFNRALDYELNKYEGSNPQEQVDETPLYAEEPARTDGMVPLSPKDAVASNYTSDPETIRNTGEGPEEVVEPVAPAGD